MCRRKAPLGLVCHQGSSDAHGDARSDGYSQSQGALRHMKAMIFAAGLGTRLGELSRERPKALVEISGRSALGLACEKLTSCGFDDIIVNIHHHPALMLEEIKKLRSEGFKITVSDESSGLLDTAGGLLKARPFFSVEPFICYSVDIFTDLDLREMYNKHMATGALATLATRHRPGTRFLLVDKNGRMCGWRNVATKEEITTKGNSSGLSETGFSSIQVLSPSIFDLMPEGIYSLTSLYLMLVREHKIMTYQHDEGYWFDCGTPANLEKIRKYLSRQI
ncbi:MAG: NTP transferase domain-containing protein [Bacteroidales bacterium]|nr:NTP transferase domain-containing protein [Bacteroidales bacterium]